jgi:hypothetical protein
MAEHSIKSLDAKQRKHYLPLESNPTVFTQLISTLLGEPSLEFHDVFSIDEPGLLAMIPRPVFALVLVFPTTKAYEEQIALEEASREEYTGFGDDEDVIWFKQTIHNACGLYAILHGVSNIYSGGSRRFISEFQPYVDQYEVKSKNPLRSNTISTRLCPRKSFENICPSEPA